MCIVQCTSSKFYSQRMPREKLSDTWVLRRRPCSRKRCEWLITRWPEGTCLVCRLLQVVPSKIPRHYNGAHQQRESEMVWESSKDARRDHGAMASAMRSLWFLEHTAIVPEGRNQGYGRRGGVWKGRLGVTKRSRILRKDCAARKLWPAPG